VVAVFSGALSLPRPSYTAATSLLFCPQLLEPGGAMAAPLSRSRVSVANAPGCRSIFSLPTAVRPCRACCAGLGAVAAGDDAHSRGGGGSASRAQNARFSVALNEKESGRFLSPSRMAQQPAEPRQNRWPPLRRLSWTRAILPRFHPPYRYRDDGRTAAESRLTGDSPADVPLRPRAVLPPFYRCTRGAVYPPAAHVLGALWAG